MKILIVCSANSGQIAPFIIEQAEALMREGVEVEYFTIDAKGLWGYLKNRKRLIKRIHESSPQLIHAHYGLSGLLANLQRRIPVVTTYLGSDINYQKVFYFSRISMLLSAYNIFVSEKNRIKSGLKHNQSLIAFGVETNLFKPMDRIQSRKELGLDLNKKLVLFAGAFHNPVKNVALAQAAIALLPNVELMKLGNGYTRQQVALLMNSVDVALMTSFSEGSPQFIKEVMACNCPVVSVAVGDVPDILKGLDGCYISIYEVGDVADKLKQALEFGKPTEGRDRIINLGLDAVTVANKIKSIYTNYVRY